MNRVPRMQGEPGVTRTKRRHPGALLSFKTSRRVRKLKIEDMMDRFFGKARKFRPKPLTI